MIRDKLIKAGAVKHVSLVKGTGLNHYTLSKMLNEDYKPRLKKTMDRALKFINKALCTKLEAPVLHKTRFQIDRETRGKKISETKLKQFRDKKQAAKDFDPTPR